jgi:hypothetical protein
VLDAPPLDRGYHTSGESPAMNRNPVLWYLSALVVLGLTAASLLFGLNLLPSSDVMKTKLGTTAPLMITWGMIFMTVVLGLMLAGYLVATGMNESRDSE